MVKGDSTPGEVVEAKPTPDGAEPELNGRASTSMILSESKTLAHVFGKCVKGLSEVIALEVDKACFDAFEKKLDKIDIELLEQNIQPVVVGFIMNMCDSGTGLSLVQQVELADEVAKKFRDAAEAQACFLPVDKEASLMGAASRGPPSENLERGNRKRGRAEEQDSLLPAPPSASATLPEQILQAGTVPAGSILAAPPMMFVSQAAYSPYGLPMGMMNTPIAPNGGVLFQLPFPQPGYTGAVPPLQYQFAMPMAVSGQHLAQGAGSMPAAWTSNATSNHLMAPGGRKEKEAPRARVSRHVIFSPVNIPTNWSLEKFHSAVKEELHSLLQADSNKIFNILVLPLQEFAKFRETPLNNVPIGSILPHQVNGTAQGEAPATSEVPSPPSTNQPGAGVQAPPAQDKGAVPTDAAAEALKLLQLPVDVTKPVCVLVSFKHWKLTGAVLQLQEQGRVFFQQPEAKVQCCSPLETLLFDVKYRAAIDAVEAELVKAQELQTRMSEMLDLFKQKESVLLKKVEPIDAKITELGKSDASPEEKESQRRKLFTERSQVVEELKGVTAQVNAWKAKISFTSSAQDDSPPSVHFRDCTKPWSDQVLKVLFSKAWPKVHPTGLLREAGSNNFIVKLSSYQEVDEILSMVEGSEFKAWGVRLASK